MLTRSLLTATAALAAFAAGCAFAAPAYKASGSVAGPDGGWDYATFDPALRRFYVSHADTVFAIDVDSGKVIAKLGDAPHGHKVVPLDGGKVLAVTVGGDNSLRFIDANSGATLASVPTAAGPDSATFDPASGLVLVAAHKGGSVDLIDPRSRKNVGSITVGGALEEVVADGTGRAFVAIEDKNEVVELDLKAKTVAKRLKIEGCDGPTGMVYAPDAHALVAACDGKAAVIDAQTLKLEKLLAIGKGPDAALYDPARRAVIIPCGQSGVIAVIAAGAPGKLAVVGTYPTEKGARTGALDPKTGNVYLPAARYLPPPPGKTRGSMEPGSFHILVMSPIS